MLVCVGKMEKYKRSPTRRTRNSSDHCATTSKNGGCGDRCKTHHYFSRDFSFARLDSSLFSSELYATTFPWIRCKSNRRSRLSLEEDVLTVVRATREAALERAVVVFASELVEAATAAPRAHDLVGPLELGDADHLTGFDGFHVVGLVDDEFLLDEQILVTGQLGLGR